MSAKEELIAAALTAVDELHDINRVVPIHDRIENQLREACARAMVQPVDYMRGVLAERDALIADNERLMQIAAQESDVGARVLREVFALCEDTQDKCSEDANDFTRGRRFEAKGIARAIGTWYQDEFCGRTHMGEPDLTADQFRDATKLVPDANDPDPLHLSRILHELAGAASMCWTPRPSTAVFDSQQAMVFVEQAIAEIRQRMQMVSAAPQPVSAASEADMQIYQAIADGYTRDTRFVSAAELADPFGCRACTHPECGRFDGPRHVECRAMAENACARKLDPQPVVDIKDAAPEMVKGGRYNWKHQKERLIYLGRNRSGNGFWHQFAKVDSPADVWCEVVDADLHMIEKTPQPVGEVPMPEPVAYRHSETHDLHDRFEEVQLADAESEAEPLMLGSDVRTYGDAREAAGYARGIAARHETTWQAGYTSGYNDGVQDGIRTDLRGEVKP